LEWQPDFIVTTGDNNYPLGSSTTIDENIGQYFHEFIYPYKGNYGTGAEFNRFFPALGNHDWDSENAKPFLDYFSLPSNERYYDFVWEPVHILIVDSDWREPDGIGLSSAQAAWLKEGLESSSTLWRIVVMHVPPFSSAYHDSEVALQWPFQDWGANAVISGHNHVYERLEIDGLVYFVNGLEGDFKYPFRTPIAGSEVRYNQAHGAMLLEASSEQLLFKFINISGEIIDTYSIDASP